MKKQNTKISASVFISKYIVPVFMLFLFFTSIYLMFFTNDKSLLLFGIGSFFVVVFQSFFSLQMAKTLKRIKVSAEKIEVIGSGEIVEYKDIMYVTKFDVSNIAFLTIIYKENITGKIKKIGYIPGLDDLKMFSDNLLTKYIKEQVKKANMSD